MVCIKSYQILNFITSGRFEFPDRFKKPLFNRQTYFWILFYIIYYFTISMSSSLEFNYLTQLPNFINLCYKYGLKVQLTMAFFSDFLLWESNSTWTQFKGTPPTLTALKYLLPFSVLCLQNQFIKVLPVEVYGHRSKGCSWFNWIRGYRERGIYVHTYT